MKRPLASLLRRNVTALSAIKTSFSSSLKFFNIGETKDWMFEQDRGHVASAVECCMKEYGISEEEAYTQLRKRIANEWKIINEECLKPTEQVMPLLKLGVNLTSAAEVFYKEGDNFTNVGKEMRSRIAGLLIHPIPI